MFSAEILVDLFRVRISLGSCVNLFPDRSMRETMEVSPKRRLLFLSISLGTSEIMLSDMSRWVRLTRELRRSGLREEMAFALSLRELREVRGLKRCAGRLSIEL